MRPRAVWQSLGRKALVGSCVPHSVAGSSGDAERQPTQECRLSLNQARLCHPAVYPWHPSVNCSFLLADGSCRVFSYTLEPQQLVPTRATKSEQEAPDQLLGLVGCDSPPLLHVWLCLWTQQAVQSGDMGCMLLRPHQLSTVRLRMCCADGCV